jgi:hypothetical protein
MATPTDICWKRPNHDVLIHTFPQYMSIKNMLMRTLVSLVVQQGKQARKSFPWSTSRSTEVLELIHSDLCGPFKTSSITGAKYFITFIDNFSQKIWVSLLKTKDSAL